MKTKILNLPRHIDLPGVGRIKIRLGSLSAQCRWGEWDSVTRIIQIEKTLDLISQRIVLLHELMHIVSDMLIDHGVRTREVPHSFIDAGAPQLFALLASAGLWKGISSQAARCYVEKHRIKCSRCGSVHFVPQAQTRWG